MSRPTPESGRELDAEILKYPIEAAGLTVRCRICGKGGWRVSGIEHREDCPVPRRANRAVRADTEGADG